MVCRFSGKKIKGEKMKIRFLGSAKEVGRSCIQISSKDQTMLLDCGVKLGLSTEYPIEPNLEKIDAVFISHAHLDHTGALPLFNKKGLNAKIFATEATKNITELLLKDAYKIALHENTAMYREENIKNIMNLFETKNLNAEYSSGKMKFKFFDAGHIPGSTSILFEIEGKKILYTGDINTKETRLLNAADTNYGRVDVMICEGTYGDKNHENRFETEKKFIAEIKKTVERGFCLIPCFAVGRAQEIALVLSNEDFSVPIHIDGMADKATSVFFRVPWSLKNSKELSEAAKKIEIVGSFEERKEAEHQCGIVIATSGMLNGGPVMDYLKHFLPEKNNSVLLTGYQADNTNGKMLLEKRQVEIDGNIMRAKCHVEKFDFSAHAGMNELHELIKKINPKKLILNHGESLSLKSLSLFAQENGIETIIPENGSEIEL
jgi:putative mRNA 3-end processing factor